MGRRKMSDEEKKAVSRRMKARWRAAKIEPSANGTRIEQRIVLHLKGTSHELTLAEATALRDALVGIVAAPITASHGAPTDADIRNYFQGTKPSHD